MAMTTLTRTVTLEQTTCATCDVSFAAPSSLLDRRRADGQSFYCPNGHSLSYRDTEAKRLQREVESLRTRATHLADQRDAAERSASALRGVVTRTKRRISNGVCPCCNRQFANVHRHMVGQHPEYAAALDA